MDTAYHLAHLQQVEYNVRHFKLCGYFCKWMEMQFNRIQSIPVQLIALYLIACYICLSSNLSVRMCVKQIQVFSTWTHAEYLCAELSVQSSFII